VFYAEGLVGGYLRTSHNLANKKVLFRQNSK